MKVICAGSAPLSADTHAFIKVCIDCPIIQGYGLTESTAGATLMELSDRSVGRVGPPIYGGYIKLIDWPQAHYHVTDKPYPRGEILVAGNTVAVGYYKNDALTREVFVEENGLRWLYTGDVGEVHPDGTIKIIDRKKVFNLLLTVFAYSLDDTCASQRLVSIQVFSSLDPCQQLDVFRTAGNVSQQLQS